MARFNTYHPACGAATESQGTGECRLHSARRPVAGMCLRYRGQKAGVDARDFKVILPVLQHVEAMAQHIEALSQILSQILNILSQIVNRGLESVLQVLNDIGDTVGVLNGGHVGHAF